MGIEFFITSLIVVVVPGTGVIYTLATGLSRGRRASVAAAFGCTLGILPHMIAAVVGVAALLHTSAVIFQSVKLAGAAYLLFMAWQVLRQRGALRVDNEMRARSAAKTAMHGILINILNPKLSMFFLAFLPQFISGTDPHPLASMLELSAVFMLMTFAVFVVYGVAAAAMRDHVISRPKIMTGMRLAFAGAFGALGIKLALAQR
jgi:threonine/homoserine/homoserine lactone efflux protein